MKKRRSRCERGCSADSDDPGSSGCMRHHSADPDRYAETGIACGEGIPVPKIVYEALAVCDGAS